MKTPISVRIVAAFFGLAALWLAFEYTSMFFRELHGSGRSVLMQLGFVGVITTLVATPGWIGIGLWRGSRDARAVALTLCWLAFVGVPAGILAGLQDYQITASLTGLAELAIFYSIYHVLTSHPVRCGFFRLPEPLTRRPA